MTGFKSANETPAPSDSASVQYFTRCLVEGAIGDSLGLSSD